MVEQKHSRSNGGMKLKGRKEEKEEKRSEKQMHRPRRGEKKGVRWTSPALLIQLDSFMFILTNIWNNQNVPGFCSTTLQPCLKLFSWTSSHKMFLPCQEQYPFSPFVNTPPLEIQNAQIIYQILKQHAACRWNSHFYKKIEHNK